MSKLKSNIVCRGCWHLGNNCGECSRCVETALAFALKVRGELKAARDVANALEEILVRVEVGAGPTCSATFEACLADEAREALQRWKRGVA